MIDDTDAVDNTYPANDTDPSNNTYEAVILKHYKPEVCQPCILTFIQRACSGINADPLCIYLTTLL